MDIVQDISSLTSISQTTLNKILTLVQLCICHGVYESQIQNENITEIESQLGTLLIKKDNDKLLYKFVPSSKFETQLVDTLTLKESPLSIQIEESLTDKVEAVYKELLRL